MTNYLIKGDPMNPQDTDLIAQTAILVVIKPTPDGWRIVGGSTHFTEIARVATRHEIEAEGEA